VRESDVLLENFGAGVLDRPGVGYDVMQEINSRLLYCPLKGFLSGPYEQRTGKGTFVRSGLFENNLFLVAQHMVQYRQTGVPAVPMPERVSAWAVYDVFETADSEQIFVGVVSDKQWIQFCNAFGLDDLLQNAELQTNVQRVARRDAFMPRLREMFAGQDLSQATKICERVGLPFAPILRPDQLFDDPHVNHTGATVEVTLSNGVRTQVPTLPFEYGGTRLGLYRARRKSASTTMLSRAN
jgi:crotonobetainyl-CoA:carnitine CoA-transferase CaiB-like acyl-CoA transferase